MRNVYGDGKDLVSEGLEIGGDVANLAEKYQASRLDKGKGLTGGQINSLNEAIINNDVSKIKSTIEQKLTEYGETGDVSQIAEVLVKRATGEKFTSGDIKTLNKSKAGYLVEAELNPQNIELGGLANKWAENIGTRRVNPKAYNKELYEQVSKPSENSTSQTKFEVSESGETTVRDKKVDIKEIVSIKNGEIILRLEDGETVNTKDVEFSSNDEGLIYENVIDMGLNAATANAFVKGYDPSKGLSVQEYALGFREAYRYGGYGIPMSEMSQDGFSASLSEAERSLAYNLGKTDAKYKVSEQQKAKTEGATVSKKEKVTKSKGKLHNTIKPTNERQRASLKALGVVAEALGIDIHIFESESDSDGKRKGANGWYNPKDKSIHIDLYAGQNGESTMLFTASHELTHFIREWSPAKFKVFADFLFDQYGKKGVSVSDLVRQQIEKAKRNGRAISYDTAYEEVVADACETMLTDSNAIEVLAKLKVKDKGLWQKIKDFITGLVTRIKNAYKGITPDSQEAAYVRTMLDTAERLQALWTEALVDAGESYKEHVTLNEGKVMYSLRDSTDEKQFNPDGKTLDEQLEDILHTSESFDGRYLYIGRFTSDFIDMVKPYVDVKDLPVAMNYRDAYLSMESKEHGKYKGEGINYHDLGKEGLKSAIESFGRPEQVLLSKKDGKVELILEGVDKKGNKLLSVVALNTDARNAKKYIEAHIVTSIYGKRSIERYVSKAESEGRLIYSKKEELAQVNSQVQYEGIVNANSPKSSIAQDTEFVNRKFSERDSDYMDAVNRGDMETAQRMVDEAAKEAGYSNDVSWRMQHTAPNSETDVSLYNLKKSGLVPNDYWDNPQWYTYTAEERESFYKIKAALSKQEQWDAEGKISYTGKPLEAKIWVYRAVDKTVNSKEEYFRNGDWVTPSYDYAVNEGKMNPNGYRIIKQSVSVKNLYWDGNSIAELGYDDGNSYAYKDTKNNRKLLDAITYDDYGNVIPLSKRFNFKNDNIRYSDRDSEGNTLSKEQQEFFKDSKVRDENGDLLVVYHGTMSGEFTVFDASKASVEGDMGAGFYFSSSYADVNSNYEEGGQDLDAKIEHLADRIESEEDISHEEAYEKAHKILVKGTHLFEVYLNMKNPAYVGGSLDKATILFGEDFYESELDENDFADEDEYYEAQYEERDAAVGELIDRVASILDDEGISGYEGWSNLVFEENGFEEGMTVSQLHELIGKNMYDVMNEDGDLASHEVVRVIIEALGYDGIIDNSVVEKWGYKSGRYSQMDGLDEDTRHYIVFRPEQIKLTTNKTPTSDTDIRYSDRRAEVRDLRQELEKANIDTSSVIDIADGYFNTYGGEMNKSELRYAFLHAMKTMTEKSEDAYERAYEEISGIADEVIYNPKNLGGIADDFKEMKNYIRRIKFKVQDVDKPEFGIYDGFGAFRKKHMGKLTLANDGISVDSVYMELQELYGTTYFPDVNTVAEQLMQIAKVVDTPLASVAEADYDLEEASTYTAQEIVMKFADLISSSWDKKQNSKPTQEPIYINYRDNDSVSNRSLLANALETTVQNDIERSKLNQYKQKIALIESEQAKLTEIRAKSNELRFTKGRTPSETKEMRDLDFEANQIANRISTYDKQLLNLESTKALKNVLEREKTMLRKKLEQKGKEALKSYKERAAKTQRELLTRYQESRKNAIEGRHKTEMRHKIKDIVSDLNKLLLNPTKDQHVPIGLQGVVAEALDAINMDTMNAEERVAYYNALIAKSSDPDEIAMLTKKRDFFEYRDMSFKDKITALKNAYAEFKESDDPLIRNAHNDAIEELIKNTADAVGNKSLKDMSIGQLEAVYDMYKAIRATVRNSNKLFKEQRQETITDTSELVKREVREIGGHKDRVRKVTKWLKTQGWNMLKPVYAMKMIGSESLENLYDNVRAGEDTWAVDVSEAKEFYRDKAEKYNFKKWDFNTQHSFKDSAGHDFSLSLEQIMSLYAYSKREQADKHLEVGGFVFDDVIEVTEKNKIGLPVKYEVNDANPYRLRKEDLGTVIAALTEEQKSFIDEMQTYLSDVMGAKGNEVSLALYDIKLYKENNYFPLKTARYFREFDPEKNGTPKIKNSGFSKKTVPQAGNPIVLSNFMDVWAKHVNDMSMYHAFVLPLEDFMRVYNYSSTAGGYDSVQQVIKNAYGTGANQYVETLMDDLNGGARVDPTAGIMNKMIGLSKKAAVLASASVVIQQPSAIFRSMAYINPKYFVGAPKMTKHKDTWAEVKKYAPVAIIKEMGYFDTGMGQSTVEWIKERKTLKDKADDVLSKAPALADELTWCAIWKAVKRETLAKNKNLSPSSEEFLKKVGERFTEVITETQVYDSVLARSGMMRSKDTGMKMATAFMAEPTTSLNMIVNAIVQGKRGNKKFTAGAFGAIAASIIVNSALVSLVYAARDDDEDETYLEKYLGSVTSELIDGFNPLTYIPFIKDIWSIFQGYDVERSDMSLISDLWQSFEKLFGDGSTYEKITGVSGALASVFGVPLKNILRDAEGTYNFFTTVSSGTPTTGAGIKYSISESAKDAIPLLGRFSENKTNSDKLYDAIMSGDADQIERMKNRFKDQDAIDSAMKTALRENDPRIKEAAQARYCGEIDEYKQIAKEIIAEGKFSQDIVVGAINAAIAEIKRGENLDFDTEADKDEVTSIYKANDVNVAFDSGDTEMALEVIEDLVKTKVANGKTEKEAKSSIRSSMTSYWKPLYIQAYKSGDSAEMERIRRILYASGLYGGGNEVVKTCQNWLKD